MWGLCWSFFLESLILFLPGKNLWSYETSCEIKLLKVAQSNPIIEQLPFKHPASIEASCSSSIFLRYHFSLTDGKREELSSNPIFNGKVSTSEEAVNRARISALAVVVERNAVIWRPLSLVQLLMQSVLPEWLSVSVCGAAAPIRLLYVDEWAAHTARALPTRSRQPIQPHQPGI